MEIDVIINLIKDKAEQIGRRNHQIEKAERYYQNKNDILTEKNPVEEKMNESTHRKNELKNPLKNADNRISHPWHRLLVNQKAAYTMTVPPKFDTKDRQMNQEITKLLGDHYAKVAKDLCVGASNAGVAWLHVWRDESNGFFRYAVVDTKQIIPIFSNKLTDELIAVLRVYDDCSETGEWYTIYEYWTNKECFVFRKKTDKRIGSLESYPCFDVIDIGTGEQVGNSNRFSHGWGEVPFIPFRNGEDELSDLTLYKSLIDVYDKVYSGFVNDLDDVQQIIFVLTNYGGEDKQEFLNDLNKYKVIKVDNYGESHSAVDTLAVDIPTDARDRILEITRESIFVAGQGVDPQKNIGQNNSGAALKHMYSLLELKASSLEAEFRQGFAKLVRFILRYFGKDPDIEITQTWTRTSINNDLEQAEIVSRLAPISSSEAVAKANPIIENWEDELAQQDKEMSDEFRSDDDFRSDISDIEDANE